MLNTYKNYGLNLLSIIPYAVEYRILNSYSSLLGSPLRDKSKYLRLKETMINFIKEDLKKDAQMCADLNIKTHLPSLTDIKEHVFSFSNILIDYNNVIKNRKNNNLKTGSKRDYPDYYNRNFHFQTDGYTSEHSAKLYDHQVDILFTGMALPMRRAILEAFRNFRPKNILELACGTGSATELVSDFLPDSKITATDLSYEYIEFAKENRPLKNVDYKQMDATDIEGTFDCIFNVFLLHELPSKPRQKVLEQMLQCLEPGGMGIVVESLQVGDEKFLDEVLYDFPVYYHEPFYKHYIENSVEETLIELGAKNVRTIKRLFSKVVIFNS